MYNIQSRLEKILRDNPKAKEITTVVVFRGKQAVKLSFDGGSVTRNPEQTLEDFIEAAAATAAKSMKLESMNLTGSNINLLLADEA